MRTALATRAQQPSASARARRTLVDAFYLACKWERYTASRLTYGSRVVEPRAKQIKLKYRKVFARLAVHLATTDLSPDQYFALLLDRISDKRRAPIILRVTLLGSKFYNQLVSEQRLARKQQFAGREDRETLTYRTIPVAEAGTAPASLARDVARLLCYRRQYHWFEWGRFWLLFGSEFSGAFLFVTPEYQPTADEAFVHLTRVQRQDWTVLAGDRHLAAQVRETVLAFRRRARTLPCLQQTSSIFPPMEQVAMALLTVQSSKPLTH